MWWFLNTYHGPVEPEKEPMPARTIAITQESIHERAIRKQRAKRVSVIPEAEALAMYDAGTGSAKLAKHYGVHCEVMSAWLRSHGRIVKKGRRARG